MRYYELNYLLSPELSEEEIGGIKEKIVSFFKKESGTIGEFQSPIKKELGYSINKEVSAFLVTLNFHLLPEKIKDLENFLKTESNILRYLINSEKEFEGRKEDEEKGKTEKKTKKDGEQIPEKTPETKKAKVEFKKIEKKLDEILGQ